MNSEVMTSQANGTANFHFGRASLRTTSTYRDRPRLPDITLLRLPPLSTTLNRKYRRSLSTRVGWSRHGVRSIRSLSMLDFRTVTVECDNIMGQGKAASRLLSPAPRGRPLRRQPRVLQQDRRSRSRTGWRRWKARRIHGSSTEQEEEAIYSRTDLRESRPSNPDRRGLRDCRPWSLDPTKLTDSLASISDRRDPRDSLLWRPLTPGLRGRPHRRRRTVDGRIFLQWPVRRQPLTSLPSARGQDRFSSRLSSSIPINCTAFRS